MKKMTINKYKNNDNNIIHEVILNNIDDLKSILSYDSVCSIFKSNAYFINNLQYYYNDLKDVNKNINIRVQKEYNVHGKNINLNKIITGNINCYKNNESNKDINIYYDLINKFNSDDNINLNRFIITYTLIMKLIKKGYNVNFIPVLFLKAFDSSKDNEYVFIKINNFNIKNIIYYDLILNDKVSRVLLPEIIKHLDIENIEALDYNGYLLERSEKENIIVLNNNDMLIDIFTSENLFNGDILYDSEVFYKKLSLRNT